MNPVRRGVASSPNPAIKSSEFDRDTLSCCDELPYSFASTAKLSLLFVGNLDIRAQAQLTIFFAGALILFPLQEAMAFVHERL